MAARAPGLGWDRLSAGGNGWRYWMRQVVLGFYISLNGYSRSGRPGPPRVLSAAAGAHRVEHPGQQLARYRDFGDVFRLVAVAGQDVVLALAQRMPGGHVLDRLH